MTNYRKPNLVRLFPYLENKLIFSPYFIYLFSEPLNHFVGFI